MDTLSVIKHRIGDTYRNTVSALTPISTKSKFIEEGTLTPEEFTQACDFLVERFPTWTYESGDASKKASYLPADKQFIITRNVPCKDRVRALDGILENTTEDDEWILPGEKNGQATVEMVDVDDVSAEGLETKGIFDDKEDFFSGVSDFSDLNQKLKDEEAAFGGGGAMDYVVAAAPDANIVRMRTYDLSITYDPYYRTPRMWLFGYSEYDEPLTPEEIYEDILGDYVSKTVTIDPHPHTGIPTVSIHPCKHAQVMKSVIEDWIAQKIEPRHDVALVVFLKFIGSVVPTMNYDFTMDVEW